MVVAFTFLAASEVAFSWIAFRLVDRLNRHFDRELRLKRAVIDLVRSAAWDDQRRRTVWMETSILENPEGLRPRVRRDPLMWAMIVGLPAAALVLVAVGVLSISTDVSLSGPFLASLAIGILLAFIGGILTLYLFYWLGKDIFDHDRQWQTFTFNARNAMSKLGLPQGKTYCSIGLNERSFVVYLILSFFVPFFTFYWWYALIKDPNEHFTRQWEFEDHLLAMTGQYQKGGPGMGLTSASAR